MCSFRLQLSRHRTRVSRHLVARTVSVERSTGTLCAHASLASWARPRHADLSAWSAQTVLRTEPVSNRSASTPVPVPAASTLGAKLSITTRFVVALLALLEILSPVASNKKVSTSSLFCFILLSFQPESFFKLNFIAAFYVCFFSKGLNIFLNFLFCFLLCLKLYYNC